MIILFGCSKKDNDNNAVAVNGPVLGQPIVESGVLAVTFVDTLSENQVEIFIQSLKLTSDHLYNFDLSTNHWSVVQVPKGAESAWINILLQYPEVKKASLIELIPE